MVSWFLWGVCLLLQNAAFTWTSRSRNSDSIKEHAVASFFSNGVYFLNLFIGVDKIASARAAHSVSMIVFTILWYTVCTMAGAISSHYALLRRREATQRTIRG